MSKKQEKAYIAPTKGKTKFTHFNLKEQVLSLLHENNLRKPTVVQADSLPITLQSNLKELCAIVYAYNGAGKTLTFLIPIFNSLEMIPLQSANTGRGGKQVQKIRPQAIIVFPTQALMSQVYEYLENYANFYEFRFKWPLKIGKIYSNKSSYGHIIVGLTTKIQQYLKQFDLSELKWMVFDECDKIKEDSTSDFKQILSIMSSSKVSANFLITSATGDKNSFRNFIQENLTTHNIVELDSKDQNMGLKGVTHYFKEASSFEKKSEIILDLLSFIAAQESKIQVIIFFNQIKELQVFFQTLLKEKDRFVVNDPEADSKNKNNLKVDYVHARCGVCRDRHYCPYDCRSSKSERVKKLRNGETHVLLGTETIGRGIDIRTVSLVINYSEPKKNKEEVSSITYIHRVGRTGRYSDEGIALTLVDEAPEVGQKFLRLVENQQKIEFLKMTSLEGIINQALKCGKKNQEITEDGSHPYENL